MNYVIDLLRRTMRTARENRSKYTRPQMKWIYWDDIATQCGKAIDILKERVDESSKEKAL